MVKHGGQKCHTVLACQEKQAALHRELVEVYGEGVMLRKQVWMCCNALADGKIDVSNEQRPGRPSIRNHRRERVSSGSNDVGGQASKN